VTAPDNHLDLDDAAALDAGLDDDGAFAAHVAACDDCARRVAQVQSTRTLLSALPDDPMPADVAARLHAALPRDPLRTTIVPVGSRRRRWTRSPALAGWVAAAAGIALVSALSIGSLRSSNHPDTSGADSGALSRAATPRTNFPVIASGAHYTDANSSGLVGELDALVRTPATLPPTAAAGAQGEAATKDALSLSAHAPVPASLQSLFGDRQQQLACARLLAGGPVTPLAIDFARFTGGQRKLHNAPAMVVLLPASGDLRDVAFIVGPKCTTDSLQDIYQVVQAPPRG
jgi:hypothetical protein